MAERRADHEDFSVTLRGHFNPSIFSPGWLLANEIITELESEQANVQMIHPQVCSFNAAGIDVNVSPTEFRLWINSVALLDPLNDMFQGIWTKLPHTPVQLAELDHNRHYRLNAEEGDAAWGALESGGASAVKGAAGPEGEMLVQKMAAFSDPEGRYSLSLQPCNRFSKGMDIRIESRVPNPENGNAGTILDDVLSQWEQNQQWARSTSASVIANLTRS